MNLASRLMETNGVFRVALEITRRIKNGASPEELGDLYSLSPQQVYDVQKSLGLKFRQGGK